MAAPMTPLKRAGTHTLEFDLENDSDGFAVEPSSPSWSKQAIWGLSTDELKQELLANEGTRHRQGEHVPGVGLWHPRASFGFSCYPTGTGTAYGDGELAVVNAHSKLASMCLGGVTTPTTGDTVAGTPTTTSVDVTTAASFPSGLQVLAHLDSNGYVVARPATRSGSTFSALMAFDTAPTATDVTPGGLLTKLEEDHAYSGCARIVGKQTTQNFKTYGMVGSFGWDEGSASQALTCSATMKVARVLDLQSLTQTPPSNTRPVPAAGGVLLIAKRGNTTAIKSCYWRVSWQTSGEFSPNECSHYEAAGYKPGIDGWTKLPGQLRVTCHIREDQAVPTGFTASNWVELFRSLTESEQQFHVFAQAGYRHGATICAYWPALVLVEEPTPNVDVDGATAMRLVFGLDQSADSSTYPNYMIYQQF